MESFGVSGYTAVGSSKEIILLLPVRVDQPKPRGEPEFYPHPAITRSSSHLNGCQQRPNGESGFQPTPVKTEARPSYPYHSSVK